MRPTLPSARSEEPDACPTRRLTLLYARLDDFDVCPPPCTLPECATRPSRTARRWTLPDRRPLGHAAYPCLSSYHILSSSRLPPRCIDCSAIALAHAPAATFSPSNLVPHHLFTSLFIHLPLLASSQSVVGPTVVSLTPICTTTTYAMRSCFHVSIRPGLVLSQPVSLSSHCQWALPRSAIHIVLLSI